MVREITKVTKWVGVVYFAAFVLLINGIFHVITGLTALFSGDVFVDQGGKLIVFDLATWGWIHLASGILIMCIGTALFSGRAWARVVAVILASLSLIIHFAFLSAYPLWSGIIMLLDVVVIYALIVHGDEASVVHKDEALVEV